MRTENKNRFETGHTRFCGLTGRHTTGLNYRSGQGRCAQPGTAHAATDAVNAETTLAVADATASMCFLVVIGIIPLGSPKILVKRMPGNNATITAMSSSTRTRFTGLNAPTDCC